MLAVKMFAEDVVEQIQEYLPAEYQEAVCSVKEQYKNNGVLRVGIQIDIPGKNLAPIVYIDSFYDEIQNGKSKVEVMKEIAETIQKTMEGPVLKSGVRVADLDMMREYLALMVVNTAANRKILKEIPHKEVADLSLLCYVDLPLESKEYNTTAKVTKQLMKKWGLSEEELFQIASGNTKPANEPVLQNLNDMVMEIVFDDVPLENLLHGDIELAEPEETILVLSNAKRSFGASMMFESEVMEKISMLFPNGFYILPSSLHEVLIVPKNEEFTPKELGEMVREVNRNEVEKIEQLSDRIYSYDKEKRQIVEVPESIERGKEMSR